jgi:hypothetical protein
MHYWCNKLVHKQNSEFLQLTDEISQQAKVEKTTVKTQYPSPQAKKN